ncbi:MAG: SBBP repeat-containing protein [Terriglobia bacterium]|jgi:hypothetical protein
MLPALIPDERTATRRIAIYAGCMLSVLFAALLLSVQGRLRAPKNIPDARGNPAFAQARPRLIAKYGRLPLSFEANGGQADARVKFLSRGRGYGLFLTGNEAVLEVQEPGVRSQESGAELNRSPGLSSLQRTTDRGPRTSPLIQNPKSKIENQFVRLRLVGARFDAEVIGRDELPGKVNYFIGNDPKKWRTNVPTYAKVRYRNVYPGVDLEYYGNQGGELEYDFIVAPGADPSAIALQVGAVREPPLRIDRYGDLVISAKGSEIRFHKPVIYQPGSPGEQRITNNGQRTAANPKSKIENPKSVEGHFILDAQNRIHFALGPYDRTKPLVIDPVLSYSTYLGGSGGDSGNAIAVDSSGSAYVIGRTGSVDFPTTNPFQASLKGLPNVFVSKLNTTGTGLVYSTYLGGSGGDSGLGIAVDSTGNAYVGGITGSTDFPTVNPFQANNKSPANGTGFVAKLDPSGSALVYSTYLGGSGGNDGDAVRGVAVDASGEALVVGSAFSTDFPTVNPLQASNKSTANGNGFVTKLNVTGSALIYSTYLGGSGGDSVFGIALDASGNAYLTGLTESADFPTANPLQATLNGPANAFVAELNPAGSALVYSTFLGGSGSDLGNAIAVDSSGSAYVTGFTGSANFPTVNPLQATNKAAPPLSQNAFVSKLNPAGGALVYSTYLGGSVSDAAFGIAVDASENAYVAGNTSSKDFPTVNPVQATNKSAGWEGFTATTAFVAELNAGGSALVYSTYLGGSFPDQANAIAVDTSGNAYVTGQTLSFDFPTVNPFEPANRNAQPPGPTAFVAELSPGPAPALSFSPSVLNVASVPVNTTSAQQIVTVTNLGNAPLTLTGITATGDFTVVTAASTCLYVVQTVAPEATCTIAITFTSPTPSLSTGTLTVTDNAPGSPHTLQMTGNGPGSPAIISSSYLGFTAYIGTLSSPQAVTLTNTAAAFLTVGSVTITGDPGEWTQTNNCLPSVGPDATCTINVVFQPTIGGPHQSTLTITDDAINSPQTVALSGTANAQGPASLSPTSLSFGDQTVGTTSPAQTIMLVNPGGPGVPEVGTSSGDFQQENQCDSLTALTIDTPCPITVWFTPTTAGPRTGTLIVSYFGSTPLTLTASLAGTGELPSVGLSATSLNFAAQTVSTKSAPQVVTLTNTSPAAIGPPLITRSGPFAETNNCGGFVPAGASCKISVTFSPIGAGTGSGTLTLTDNAGTQTVSLSGTGMDFAVTSSATSQTVSAGQSANYSLTLAPQGGFDQTVNLTCTRAPSESTCTLTPNTVTLNGTASGTVAVAISTTAQSLAPPQGRFLPPSFTGLGRVFWLYALLWLASVLVLAGARKRRAAWLLGAGLLVLMLWSACGGGGTTTPPPSNPGTPAGTYTVDVTATDASTSTLTHTIKLTLTVN